MGIDGGGILGMGKLRRDGKSCWSLYISSLEYCRLVLIEVVKIIFFFDDECDVMI